MKPNAPRFAAPVHNPYLKRSLLGEAVVAAVPGFDGKVRERAPSVSRWLLLSFAISAAWWLGCIYAFGGRVSIFNLIFWVLDLHATPWWSPFVGLVPIVLSILLAIRMGLTASGSQSWRLLVGFAFASSLFAQMLLVLVF